MTGMGSFIHSLLRASCVYTFHPAFSSVQVHTILAGDSPDSAQLLLLGHRRIRRTSVVSVMAGGRERGGFFIDRLLGGLTQWVHLHCSHPPSLRYLPFLFLSRPGPNLRTFVVMHV